MMKRIYNIALGLIVCLSFVACIEDEEKETFFSLDKTSVTFGDVGGTDVVNVMSNESWTVSVTEPWLSVTPATGIGNAVCTIVVDSSLVNDIRKTAIRFTPATQPSSVYVKVNQMGYDKKILPADSVISIESSAKLEERYFETTVLTNILFTVELDSVAKEWLTPEKVSIDLDKGARPRTTKLRFDWRMNTVPEQREAIIKLVPQGEGAETVDTAFISVRQKPGVKIEDNRAGDSIALTVIYERMNCWSDAWDTSENLQYWRGVTLWEAADEEIVSGEVPQEAVGRVRAVQYSFLNTKEDIPSEIRHLKYLESLSISSNVNTMLLNIELGSSICELEHLKYLTIFSYGIVSLPNDFVNLKSLVALDLSANNFTELPMIDVDGKKEPMLTKDNFPNLKSLSFVASRRWQTIDLRKKGEYESKDGLGLHINITDDPAFRKLLLWEDLEELAFSNCYLEGKIPDFKVGEDSVVAYTGKDIQELNDSIEDYKVDYLLGKPKILPNCTMLRLNLNFLTGELPDWLLFHPHFLDWAPDLLIFNQQEKGLNSAGESVRFDNEPTSFDYYYKVFPGAKEKYELKDGTEEDETTEDDEITEKDEITEE